LTRHRKGRRPDLPEGFTLLRHRSGHYEVLMPNGEPLRYENGIPVRLSFSPSDWRTGKNEQAQIRRAIENLESQVREERDE
jgi:hypothetical protein